MATTEPTTGRTADGTWQFGVRRTLALTPDEAWHLLTSPAGLAAWLGDEQARLEPGATFAAVDGSHGEVTSTTTGVVARLRWHAGPDAPATTLQVRALPGRRGTAIAFHHERLPAGADREAMATRWTAAIDALEALADTLGR